MSFHQCSRMISPAFRTLFGRRTMSQDAARRWLRVLHVTTARRRRQIEASHVMFEALLQETKTKSFEAKNRRKNHRIDVILTIPKRRERVLDVLHIFTLKHDESWFAKRKSANLERPGSFSPGSSTTGGCTTTEGSQFPRWSRFVLRCRCDKVSQQLAAKREVLVSFQIVFKYDQIRHVLTYVSYLSHIL